MSDSPEDTQDDATAEAATPSPPPKLSERLLIDAWPTLVAESRIAQIICTSQGRAQLAAFAAARYPASQVTCAFLDAYQLRLAVDALGPAAPPNLRLVCEPDLIGQGVDVVALPLSSQGDGELARDLLQQAYQALRDEGLLLTSTDNPSDTWLAEQAAALGGKVRRLPAGDGVVYSVRRTAPLKRVRDFRCDFAFRDGDRLVHVMSRPGVFSHRRIDPGARRLIDALHIGGGERIVDLGCGWGAVGLAAALRHADVVVEALDSNARAVECTQLNAERNGVAERLTVRLDCEGRISKPGTFDVALGNPPYYANFRIAELFASAAYEALRPGGRLLMVTKLAAWYLENLPLRFRDVEAREIKGYVVVSARKS